MEIHEQQSDLRRALETQGIADTRVLDVIERTRRDLFVPEEMRPYAYDDNALPIGEGQTISQPYIVALMTQALALEGEETVLEIGTGSGYQAAILAALCGKLVTMERIPGLADPAKALLERLGFDNIEYVTGDGTLGYPAFAPYDGIIVTAAAPQIPEPLYEQLKPGGRMAIPVGDESLQRLLLVEKPTDDGEPQSTTLCGCRFVKLIGAAGW